jgi:hypothetical protein
MQHELPHANNVPDIDNLKTRNSTLQTLIEAILNYSEQDAFNLVRQIRTCESLDDVAESILSKENSIDAGAESPMPGESAVDEPTFEAEISSKMGELRIEDGSVRFFGGTSHLIYHSQEDDVAGPSLDSYPQQEEPLKSWTTVTSDTKLIKHLMNMYFAWHYQYFCTRTPFIGNRLCSSADLCKSFQKPLLS